MAIELQVKARKVFGDLSLPIPPGTVAAEIEKRVTTAIKGALFDAAEQLNVVVAASTSKFVKSLPGKDADGLNRYTVRGRAEGGRLIPDFGLPSGRRPFD